MQDQQAVLTCKEDSDCPDIVRQEIEYTDFPLEYVKVLRRRWCPSSALRALRRKFLDSDLGVGIWNLRDDLLPHGIP